MCRGWVGYMGINQPQFERNRSQWTLCCWSWHRLLMTLFTCEHTSAKHHQAMYVQEAEFYSSMGKQYTTAWPCLPTPNASNTHTSNIMFFISITPVAPPRQHSSSLHVWCSWAVFPWHKLLDYLYLHWYLVGTILLIHYACPDMALCGTNFYH